MPHGSQTRKLGWNLFRGASGMGRRHRGTSTPQDLLLPEGKLIRTTRGGPNALKQLLLDLKKYSFSGYVRTVRGGSGKRSEGIVLLRGGNPEASLYHRDGTQDRGRSALKKVWQDSYDESCVLELHARVDMDGLVREYTNAILERPAKVVKKTKIPQTMERSDIEKQIRAWKDLDLVMKQQQALRSDGSPYSTEDLARKVLEESQPARDAQTNVVQAYTFESFIVGESNRFAHGAAVAVAKQPAKEYNPLLITSGPGLGKTHLLHAIGNYIVSHAKESKVMYMTCEAFASSLANAKEIGTLSAFRDRIRGMDCLMIEYL